MSPLLTLDQVTTVEKRKRAQGFQNVPSTLSIFSTHFPRFPVLPGVLILGSLTELSIRLLQEQTAHQWRLARVEQVRFRHFVQPGDQLEITVELKDLSTETALLTGKIQVDGRVVTTVRQIKMVSSEKGAD